MLRLRANWTLLLIVIAVLSLSRCSENSETIIADSPYLNHADTVKYVGINTCKQCHANIYETYVKTGMGSSFHPAIKRNSAANFGDQILIDSSLGLSYQPFWRNDSLWLLEFRIEGKETIYKREEKIDYIVGSGQHTNSHMHWTSSYLHQAPFTWYAQEEKLDLPPGFENGLNSRFSRKIGLECTSCHNAMPTEFEIGSVNKYKRVPGAIDCERCHGPGEVHVRRMQAGKFVDTAREVDYSIVNIGKLAPALQFEVCQRCHLQGNPVLAEGKSFLDFKPGMILREVMDVYLPRYSNAEDDFIMASHADRFKQSRCRMNNEDFNCTSCHNPHVSVKETEMSRFNSVCGNCHGSKHQSKCRAPEQELLKEDNNCVGCHMPRSASTDIPHVSIHDHRIQLPSRRADTEDIRKFLGLVAVNNPKPSNRSKVLAYLQQYERFTQNPLYLDSASYFLSLLPESEEQFKLEVYFKYLSEDYEGVIALVGSQGVNRVLGMLDEQSYDNFDGWTAYRIGESARKTPGNAAIAEQFLARSVALMPYAPDVGSTYSSVLINNGKKDKAEQVLRDLLNEYPFQEEALNNLGFLYLTSGKFSEAKDYFRKALDLNPDYELGWLNMASACLQLNELEEAGSALIRALEINPNNQKARMLYQNIKEQI